MEKYVLGFRKYLAFVMIGLVLTFAGTGPVMSQTREEREDKTIYKVVVNHEDQYSIWPADRENALGWNDVGKKGTKEECLAYIKEVWTDMRPTTTI